MYTGDSLRTRLPSQKQFIEDVLPMHKQIVQEELSILSQFV
jgi:hypothetical protein